VLPETAKAAFTIRMFTTRMQSSNSARGILARGTDQQMFFQRFAILFGQLAKAYLSHAPSGQ